MNEIIAVFLLTGTAVFVASVAYAIIKLIDLLAGHR